MLYGIWRNEPEELGASYLNHLIVELDSEYEFTILHFSNRIHIRRKASVTVMTGKKALVACIVLI